MGLIEYSGLTTKLRAMTGKLITPDDYRNLSTLTEVSDFIDYLSETNEYRDILARYDNHSLHRDNMEQLFILSEYNSFAKIYAFASARQRKFLDLYVIKYEVSMLKTVMRHFYNPDTTDVNILLFRDFFLKFSNIDLKTLYDCQTFEEMIDSLKGSRFYDTIIKVSELPSPTLFDYELHLDLYYFNQIWKKRAKYTKGKDLDILTNNYGQTIDLLNIRWIYRTKKYYHLTKEKVLELIIPVNYRMSNKKITELIQCDNAEDFLSIIKATPYGRYLDVLESNSLEDLYNSIENKINTMDCKRNPYSIAIIDYYFYKKEQEVKKLTFLLESIRYKLDHSYIEQYFNSVGFHSD